MSLTFTKEDTLFTQRFLKGTGFYSAELDGVWGEKTDIAHDIFEQRTDEIAAAHKKFDSRSERCIASLHPKAQKAAREFLEAVIAAGIDARIISGTRTYAEQNVLFNQGRDGNSLPKVTNARGGQSNHNFGIAWDIGIFEGRAYLGESPLYKQAAEVGLTEELEWGGHWKSFRHC